MEEGDGVGRFMEVTLEQCFSHTMHIRIFSQFLIPDSDVSQMIRNRAMILEWSFHHPVEGGDALPFRSEAWQAAHAHLPS
jgi:hypothetical protein